MRHHYLPSRPTKRFGLFVTAALLAATAVAQNTWVAKAPYAGGGRKVATAFTIGGSVYVGTGVLGTSYYRDFWQYNPQSDTWTQKAAYGGAARVSASGFSIGNVGFLGLGQLANGAASAVLYAYDAASNTWVQFSNFPLAAGRYEAATFVVNNRAYITGGTDGSFNYRDCWEFNPLTDTWTQKANFGGAARSYPSAFALNGEGYVGLGAATGYFFDLWRYTPGTNTWTRRADFPGGGRSAAVGFAIGPFGYFATGYNGSAVFRDLWEYNPTTDAWTQRAAYGGPASNAGVAAVVGNKAYVGLGADNTNAAVSAWWEYSPIVTSATAQASSVGINVFPNPATDVLEFALPPGTTLRRVVMHNASGQVVVDQSPTGNATVVRELPRGMYTVFFTTTRGSYTQRVLLQ
ncbi:kelch repeat-containing protein [Hymenobacter koreensis]|uniref:T9SS type A sorting domain-containing protein n=1 Tax=Hymenobacter koreensis TaxID=1084523 RepID=A0ABP8JEH1_9BACT